MATSVSRRLNILCIMFKIRAFFLTTLFTQLYVRLGYFIDRIYPIELELKIGLFDTSTNTSKLIVRAG